MYDELTKQDIAKMQEEIDYRVQQLRPKLIEDVQTSILNISAPSRTKTATMPASATYSA